MSLLNQLRERASAKKFAGRPIDKETLEKVLEATSYSPRAANLQHFSLRVVTDSAEIKRLSQLFFDCEVTASASALLVFFTDQKTTGEYFTNDGLQYPFDNLIGYHFALADAVIAMQTAALTAENLGLATRVLAGSLLRAKALSMAFNAPESIVPAFTLALGYENDKSSPKRHNLNWQTYTAQGMSTPWPSADAIYVKSGKDEADFKFLNLVPTINAKTEASGGGGKKASAILANLKYRPEDIAQFSHDLRSALANLFK